jgi:diacylglycerol kinase
MGDFLSSRLASFKHAFTGLRHLIHTQKNAWIHAVISILVIVLGLIFSIPAQSWVVIFLTIGMVWMAELFNTAVETIVDLVSPQKHPLAKIAKDVAAGAVLVTAITSILVGVFIFGPPLLQWVHP